ASLSSRGGSRRRRPRAHRPSARAGGDDPGAGGRRRERTAVSRRRRRPGTRDRRALCRPRDRRVDGALHRDARPRPHGCIAGGRPRRPPRARERRIPAVDRRGRARSRGVAPVARVRRHAALDFTSGKEDRTMILEIAELGTPIGTLVLVVRDGRVCALELGERWPRRRRLLERRFGGLELRATTDPAGVASRLARYFEGDVRALDDIPVDVTGTPFQRKVWTALREIAPGAVASYQ